MRPLELARDVLNDVINEGTPFQRALKKAFPRDSEDRVHASLVSSLVGCSLRHYWLFLEFLKRAETEYADDEKFLILAALSNNFFLKRMPVEDVLTYLKETLGDKYVPKLDELLRRTDSVIDMLDETVSRNSLDFLALRFNTPRWLIRMWQRQFSRSLTFRILKRNNRPRLFTCRVNTLRTDEESLLNDYPDSFVKSKVPDVLIYQGKTPLRKTEFFRNFDVFIEKMALKHVIDEVYSPAMKDVLLYSGADDAVIRDFYMRIGRESELTLAVPSLAERPELDKLIRYYRARNVELIELNAESDPETAIRRQPELAIVYPKSSAFDDIRQYPDFLIHFDRASFDPLIAGQKEALEKVAPRVREDGKILYVVDTLSKREGHVNVMDFLAAHRDYELVEEKQYFPSDELDTALYFAILRKVGESRSD